MIRSFRFGNSAAMGSASNLSAIVSGAGTAAANGTYTYSGLDGNGNPYYNKSGTNPLISAISVNIDNDPAWFIYRNVSNEGYYSGVTTPNPTFPWEETTWIQGLGNLPVPVVTHS